MGSCRKPTEVSRYILWIQEEVTSTCKVLLLAHASCQTALKGARHVGGDHLHTVRGYCPAVLATCLQGMHGWSPAGLSLIRCLRFQSGLSVLHMASLRQVLAVPEASCASASSAGALTGQLPSHAVHICCVTAALLWARPVKTSLCRAVACRCGAAAALLCCIGVQAIEQAVEGSPEGGTVQGRGADQDAPPGCTTSSRGWPSTVSRCVVATGPCKSGLACAGQCLVTFHCSAGGMQLSETCSRGDVHVWWKWGLKLQRQCLLQRCGSCTLQAGSLRVQLGKVSDSHACCRAPSSLADCRAAIAASILRLLPMHHVTV